MKMAPASTTTSPDTTRLAVPLSSWSLRMANCHAGEPPRNRATSLSTAQGSNAATLTSSRPLPAARTILTSSVSDRSSTKRVAAISAAPSPAMDQRQPILLR